MLCRSIASTLRSGAPRRAFHSHCENILTITGSTSAVDSFKTAVQPVQPRVSNAATRPTHAQLWSRSCSAQELLSFQSLRPSAEGGWPWGVLVARQDSWGCTTDAMQVELLEGRPRLKGRSSIRYSFETGDSPPLRWLDAAAQEHPSLRLGFKYAVPATAEAYEMEYLQGRLVCRAQVSFATWMWGNRVHRPAFFQELKALLHLPDGRLSRKRKLTAEDVEARLLAGGELPRAVELLSASVRGWAGKSRLKKLWRAQVLPEFVAWLHAPVAEPEPLLVA